MRVKVKLRQAVIGKTLCIAAAALLLSACSTPDRTPVVLEGEPVTNGYVEDLPPAAAEGAYRADSADVAILSQMTKMMENAHIEFYLGEYYDIAVLDKDTGCVYFSNKAIYDEELSDQMMPEGMDETYSQITLEYFDGADQVFTLASYPDSVEEDKVNIAGETDSVTVTYTFGVKDLDKTICTAFTVEDFNKINELANQKIEEGTLGLVDYRRFYNSYIHIDIDKYNSAELQLYLDQYPALKTWGELYVLQIPPTDITKSIVSEVSPILGIDSAYIQQSMEKIGMEKNAISNSMYFEIPIVYRLDERDLLVSLDTSRIVSQDGFKLTQVNLFNDFAASLGSDNGYVFIPEGSGSIVENTAVTTGQATLDIPFYGSDFCVDHKTSDTVAPYASLPVFGATEEGRGYLAIVESGAANGGVTARVQDSVVPYSTVGPWVTYYSQDVNADGNYIYKKSPAKTEFKVRYHFLYGEDSTYSGMARYYQKYLLQTGLLKKSSERSGLPLNLNFVCGIDKDQVVFGVPVKKVFAASTMEGIQDFAGRLAEAGVGTGIDYTLIGAINGGMDHKIPAEIHVEKAVGGEDGYLQLRDFLHAGGNRLNLNIDFSVVYKNGNGLDQDRQIARYIDKRVAYLANYSPSSFLKTTARSAYLVDPQSYAGIADRFLESNARLNNPNVFVSSIGSYLWGNYNEKSPLERDQSKLYAVQAQKKLKDAGYRVMIDGGNDYALANADHITDISVENGGYAITSYSVPFVGMVLHGYVDYSGPPLNKQRNYETSLLKNIESGAGLNYWLMTEDPKIFAQTAYTDMYNISSETWLERICQTYTELQTVFEPLKDCTITGHARLQDNVTETRYSDGTRILVNGNASDVTVGADTISAYSYKVIKG